MSFLTKTDLSMGPQMGSQMSQYAGLYALSKKMGHDIVFFRELMNVHRGIKIFEPFNLTGKLVSLSELQGVQFCRYYLKNQVVDLDVYSIDPSLNWDIMGCFHVYKYWDEYRSDICKEYRFKKEIVEKASSFLQSIKPPFVSMHFRRTDYLQVSSLNLDLNYYQDAFNIIQTKVPQFTIIVFSDDIPWCKENITGDNVVYSENNSNYVDMCIMSMCNHNIIANSTFGWWGAYLNPNPDKIVVCPYQYVGPGEFDFINGSWFPSDWISIKV
jgi:hypothetical protein